MKTNAKWRRAQAARRRLAHRFCRHRNPMHLAKHDRTANAVLSLIVAAAWQRDLGNRSDMRALALDARRLQAHFDATRRGQLLLAL